MTDTWLATGCSSMPNYQPEDPETPEVPEGLVREQTYMESLWEAKTNIAIGFVISWLVWVLVVTPLWGFPFSFGDSIGITCIFTVTSLARQFAVRRWFNRRARV